jgi:hypothetical protein
MSQYLWDTTDGWSVLVGWDRPLQHFFVSIDRVCSNCKDEGYEDCPKCDGRGTEYLFNNLDDNTGMTDHMGGMSIDQVRRVLLDKLTVYQEGVLGMLILDQAANVGNKQIRFEPYGAERKRG